MEGCSHAWPCARACAFCPVFLQASALSDQLVELLLEAGKLEEAAEAMERCLTARTQLFGRDLAVVRSMGKAAAIEARLDKVGAHLGAAAPTCTAPHKCE